MSIILPSFLFSNCMTERFWLNGHVLQCISTDEGPGPKRLERNSNHKTAHLLISFCLTFPYLLEFDLLSFVGSLSLYTCGISWPLMGGKKRSLNLYRFKLAWNVFLRRQLNNKKRKTATTAKKEKIISRCSSKSNSNPKSKSNSNSNYCRCPTRGSRILVYSPSVFAITQARHPFV